MIASLGAQAIERDSWFVNPAGCKPNATREEVKAWYTEKPRGFLEGSSPLMITGIITDGIAALSGLIGLSGKGNSLSRWLGVFLGSIGTIMTLIGGAYTFKLISEAKTESAKRKTQQIENRQPTTLEKAPEPDIRPLNPSLRIISANEELEPREVKALLELGERPTDEELDSNSNLEHIINRLENLEEKLSAEKIVSSIRAILTKVKKKGFSNLKDEVYVELFEIGKSLPLSVIAHGLLDKNKSVNKWAALCLLTRAENEEAIKRVFMESVRKNPQIIVVLDDYKNLASDQHRTISEKAKSILSKIFLEAKTA